MKRMPVGCPSCGNHLTVTRLHCDKCDTEVSGVYVLPPLAGLLQEDQEFILRFVKASGSLKDMATQLGVSYPTVRSRIDDIIAKLHESEPSNRKEMNHAN